MKPKSRTSIHAGSVTLCCTYPAPGAKRGPVSDAGSELSRDMFAARSKNRVQPQVDLQVQG